MKMPDNEIIVIDIAGRHANLYSKSFDFGQELISHGFHRSDNFLTREIHDDSDRKSLVRFLIKIDALFSAGRDWSPEEIVDLYKEQGVINQSHRVIAWTSPDHYVILTK